MTQGYCVRIGMRRRRTPAQYLYSILYREAGDDGKVVLAAGVDSYDPGGHLGAHPAVAPLCGDCGVGRLAWAEAGHVPFHRICNVCGSHWDAHPISMGPTIPTPQILSQIEFCTPEEIDARSEWCETCDYQGVDHCSRHRPIQRRVDARRKACQYVRFATGQGIYPS